LSNREAAEILGIDPAAASQRYGRALLRLRAELAGESSSECRP
jgi:DNA-directed RNA polymerase specialized sigma24 family protein